MPKQCKDGKVPTGKNGRCVAPKTKTCKDGKVPSGKNGRCVKVKSLKVKSLKVKSLEVKPLEVKPVEVKPLEVKPLEAKPSEVKPIEVKPLEVKPRKVRTRRAKTPVAFPSKENVRTLIHAYMNEIGEEDFFTEEEITRFVDIASKRRLSNEEIRQALDDYSKDYGEFA